MKNQTWKARVQKVYANLAELQSCDENFGIAKRCGFEGKNACKRLWEENPMIGGSTDPEDFGLAEKIS